MQFSYDKCLSCEFFNEETYLIRSSVGWCACVHTPGLWSGRRKLAAAVTVSRLMSSGCRPKTSNTPPASASHCMGDTSGVVMSGHTSERALYASEQHARLLLAQMNKMRLRTDFCDVRLCVGGRVFGVHRLVLAASGPYFAALFSGAMSEAHEEEVRIEGVEAEVFEKLLEFVYTGTHVLMLSSVFLSCTDWDCIIKGY